MDFDFAEVLLQVMERNASDLHLTAGSPPMIRHHGTLHALDYPHLTPQLTREVIYSILTNEQRQRLETDWQIDLAYSIPGKARFRVNAYMQRAALSAAFRLIPHDMPKLSSLGLPPVLEDFTKKPRGFVLVTGPTGSGKSTTLAAMLDLINDTRHEHILSIEDPIEFLHRHKKCIVNQRELGADAQSFSLGLKAALRREIKAAMIYPSLIGGFAFVVLFALVAFLVPVFEKIFKDFGGELPAITKFTVFLSHLFTERFYVLFGGIALTIFLFKKWKNSERGRIQWDRLKLKFPMKIGDICQKVALARFSRTFSGLIAAGVPMLEAIDITGKTSGNKVIEMAMNDVRESVKKGGSLTAPMMAVPEAFPIMVTQMIGVGEETGALETMMSKIADFYEEQVATAVKALTSILEPIMIVFVGGIVGFIVIAMYLPMFKVYDSIK